MDGEIRCTATGDACQDHCCACDRDATNCFARERASWNPDCRSYDRSSCSADGPPACCGDSDCEVGEVCFQGDCYPLCGGEPDPDEPTPVPGEGAATTSCVTEAQLGATSR